MTKNSVLTTIDLKLDSFFHYHLHGSSLKTELKAGFHIFVSMAYVVILIPALLAHGGLVFGAALSVTILMILICSAAMAIFTNRPLVLAPGIGTTAIFSYTLLGSLIPIGIASGIVVVSGVFFMVISFIGGRDFITKVIPDGIKISIGAGVGLFIGLLGLKEVGVIVVNVKEKALVFGDIIAPNAMLAIIGFFILLAFFARRTFAGILIALFIITLIGIPMDITKLPASYVSWPDSIDSMFDKIDILGALNIIYLPFYLTFFMSDFFGSKNTIYAVAKEAKLLENDRLPKLAKCFKVDSLATTLGGFFSSPVITIYAESINGAKAGGKTGLCSLSAAFMFLIFLFLTPLCEMIPMQAIAPLLIILGISTLSSLKGLDYDDLSNYLPAFVCISISIFSFNGGNVGNGIAAALLIYAFIKLVSGRGREVHYFIYCMIPVIIYYFYAEALLY